MSNLYFNIDHGYKCFPLIFKTIFTESSKK